MSLLIDEAIGLVNTEIRILNMQIKYPVQFQNRKNKLPLSPLYLTDETYLIEIMEIVSGLFLSKRVERAVVQKHHLQKSEEPLNTFSILNWAMCIRSMKVSLVVNHQK